MIVYTGTATYPGVIAIESVEFTDIVGISPASATIMMYPQEGTPDLEGDLTFFYQGTDGTDNTVTIKDMRFDVAQFVRNSGGQTVRVRLLDERWDWQFPVIHGRYNIKFVRCYDAAFTSGAATEFVDLDHEKTPQELALLCIEAMGYSDDDWDVSRLPDTARPEVNWDAANASKALADLCDTLGCVIIPVRSSGKWKISLKGEDDSGGDGELPDYPYNDPLDGVDPSEAPDFVEILSAPILIEMRIPLEAVGEETDQSYKLFSGLSYAPIADDQLAFAFSDNLFEDISAQRILMPDQSLVAPREFAVRSVLRTYKVQGATDAITASEPEYNLTVPGLDDPISIQQLILTDNRVQSYLIPGSTSVQPLRAYIEGKWWSDLNPCDDDNYPLGSRIDLAARSATADGDADDSISFSIRPSEDCRFTLITFSRQVVQSKEVTDPISDQTFDSVMIPAELFLHTAVKVRDKDTWLPMRTSVKRYIGDGPEPEEGEGNEWRTMTVIKNDIQSWIMNKYSSDGTLVETTDNKTSVEQRANFYIDQIVRTFETRITSSRNYDGIFEIDMDGALMSVTWRVSNQDGQSTIASLNTEHKFEQPSYEARRAQDARKGAENKAEVETEITQELADKGLFVK